MKHNRVLEQYNKYKLGWLHDSLFFIIMIISAVVLFRFVIGIAIVGGDSMYPTLADGDVVVYFRLARNYKVGDIVSVRVPSNDYYIKRVVALAGDEVDLRDGKLYVNETEETAAWAYGVTVKESGAIIYPYTVFDGNVFVLGDNREVSLDSRTFGEVSLYQIKGKIIFQLHTGKRGGKQ